MTGHPPFIVQMLSANIQNNSRAATWWIGSNLDRWSVSLCVRLEYIFSQSIDHDYGGRCLGPGRAARVQTKDPRLMRCDGRATITCLASVSMANHTRKLVVRSRWNNFWSWFWHDILSRSDDWNSFEPRPNSSLWMYQFKMVDENIGGRQKGNNLVWNLNEVNVWNVTICVRLGGATCRLNTFFNRTWFPTFLSKNSIIRKAAFQGRPQPFFPPQPTDTETHNKSELYHQRNVLKKSGFYHFPTTLFTIDNEGKNHGRAKALCGNGAWKPPSARLVN